MICSKVSKFMEKLIAEVPFEKVSSLASGNRALMLLEGKFCSLFRMFVTVLHIVFAR